MDYEIWLNLLALILGVILGSSYLKVKIKYLAYLIKRALPGKQLEILLGELLIELGQELKNGDISAEKAFTQISKPEIYNQLSLKKKNNYL